MTRSGSFDDEIGRGRQRNEDDSSSSRESSMDPRRAPKRSISPQSDDGDVVIQNENKNKTSPQPIIRQPVAFPVQASQVPVMTYEAKVVQPKKNHFLPGQEVPRPPKQKDKKNKKKRKPDAYSGQTSRFRLETYDPTPPNEPPTTHGNGPYSSLYRTVGPPVYRRSIHQGPSNGVSAGGSTSVSNTTSFPANNSNTYLPSNRPNDGSNTASTFPHLQPVTAQTNQQIFTINEPTTPSLNPQSQGQTQAPTPSSRPLSVDSHSSSTYVTDTTLTVRQRSSPSQYYRRNYDDKHFALPRDSRTISRNTSTKSSSPDSWSLGLTQVVTLLITDIRIQSGDPDHQLAEVKIPLKKADELEEGWWADAKDIVAQLQAGAARIDGPARVYTMRGKYRQFILRVTAENRDEIVSANVPVSADRTLDLTVETLHPPGVPTRPLLRPKHKWSRTYDDHIQPPEERIDVDLNRAVPQSRKRRASPSFDDYDGRSDCHSAGVRRRDRGWDRSPPRRSPSFYGDRSFYATPTSREFRSWRNTSMDRGQRRRSRSPEYHNRPTPSPPPLARGPLPTVHVGPGYPRRDEDEESCDLPNDPFIGAVEHLLREDLESSDAYFKAMAGNKVCDIVKQYEVVSRIFSKWVGKRPSGFSQHIEETHIAQALEIEDPQAFINNCEETLAFLKLYGKRGRVTRDPRVLDMLDDQNPPPVNSDPAQRLLRLLRAVDDAWRNDRSGPLLNGIMLPEPSNAFDRAGPYSPETTSKGSVHGQVTNVSPRPPSHVYPSTSKATATGGPEERGPETARYLSRGKPMFAD